MEFFKGLGNKISQTSQDAIKKTKEIADATKLNGEISAEEKKICGIYQNIGQKYYELHGDEPDGEFIEFINEIKESLDKIELAKEEIQRLKGKRNCSNCGAEHEIDTLFCSKCGFKMPPIEKPAEIIENQETEEVHKKVCSKCNEVLEDEALFCPSCGTKVE